MITKRIYASCKLCKTKKNTCVFDNKRTIYCLKHAKIHDKPFYDAYHLKHKCATSNCVKIKSARSKYCVACSKLYQSSYDKCKIANCSTSRFHGLVNGKETQYCRRHAKIYDVTFHNGLVTTYRMTNKCKNANCNSLKTGRRYGVQNEYCIKCAKEYNPTYTQKRITERKCKNTTCNATYNTRVYNSTHTKYCTNCAKFHDGVWYNLYRQFYTCNNVSCTNLRVSDDSKYCIECTKTYNKEWYNLYWLLKKCKMCPNRRIAVVFDGYTTEFCIKCLNKYDLTMYQIYLQHVKCHTQNCMHQIWLGHYCYSCAKRLKTCEYQKFYCEKRCQHHQCVNLMVNEKFCKKHTPGYITSYCGVSKIGCAFLDLYQEYLNVTVQHEHYDKENLISGNEYKIVEYGLRGTKVDGYVVDSKTIIEFHGDHYHGNPETTNPEEYPWYQNTLNYGQLYEKTMFRMHELKRLGYNVIYVWENDFFKFQKGSKTKDNFFAILRSIE